MSAPSVPNPGGEGTERPDWWTRIERSVGLLVSVSTLAVAAFTWISIRQVNRDQNLTREGQITDRYNAAVTNLGDDSEDVRLGGVYALQRIMEDSPRDQSTIINIICAFIRTHSAEAKKDPKPLDRASSDVIAAAAVLNEAPLTEREAPLDLEYAFLPKVDLRHVNLRHADLVGADLAGADLAGADLTGANLDGAVLAGTNLRGAHLVDASLTNIGSDMNMGVLRSSAPSEIPDGVRDDPFSGANLEDADLTRADLTRAYLYSANLGDARLCHAQLADADLSGANLNVADLRYADLSNARLNGADMGAADIRHANLHHADVTHGQLSDAGQPAGAEYEEPWPCT